MTKLPIIEFSLICSIVAISYVVTPNDSTAAGFQYTNQGNYSAINVPKLMSIAENSTEFKGIIEEYDHYSFATVIPKFYSQNTSSSTQEEFDLVYSLYSNPDENCHYNKVLVLSLNADLEVIGIKEYLPLDVPTGYPLPPASCPHIPPNNSPPKIDYNKLVTIIPAISYPKNIQTNGTNFTMTQSNVASSSKFTLVTPLKQIQLGIPARDVKCEPEGFLLILKSEDGTPACVSPTIAQILLERGWAKTIVSKISNSNYLSSNSDPTNTTNEVGPPHPQEVTNWLANHPHFFGCIHTDLKINTTKEIPCFHPELIPIRPH